MRKKKKYIVSKWMKLKMNDEKPIIMQAYEYENIFFDILEFDEGMKMYDYVLPSITRKT